jgi:signal peptidase I
LVACPLIPISSERRVLPQMEKPAGRVRSIRELPTVLGGAAFGLTLGGLLALLLALQLFGYRVLTIQSYSMEPTLTRGDLIITRPVQPTAVEDGDIALFADGNQVRFLVAHRVVAHIDTITNVVSSSTGAVVSSSTSRQLLTKGDANERADSNPVTPDRLQGVVWLVVPGAGLLLNVIPIQYILFGIAGLSSVAWIIYEIVLRRRRQGGSQVEPASR